MLDYFIAEPDISEELRDMQYAIVDQVLGYNFQENCTVHSLALALHDIFNVHSITDIQSKTVEISPGKHLNISAHLTTSQEEQMITLLNKHSHAFAWEYTDMLGIHHETCTHHIYTDDKIRPLRQPQRRMNPILK